jgi:short-subunit dehydrogenase
MAELVAAAGVNVVLCSRRAPVLERRAAELRAVHGVQARTVAADLATFEGSTRLLKMVADLEVGLLLSTPGADDRGSQFLDLPLHEWQGMVQRNVLAPLALCHGLGRPMRERGRGGIVLISSTAAFLPAARVAVYAATKAFDRAFTESLWAELSPAGVDVLSIVLAATDTPAMRRMLERAGGIEIDGLADPADVALAALTRLPEGPSWVVGEDDPAAMVQQQLADQLPFLAAERRREHVAHGSRITAQFFARQSGE